MLRLRHLDEALANLADDLAEEVEERARGLVDAILPDLAYGTDTGEFEIVYHYAGQSHKHSTGTGKEFFDQLKELDRKGAIVDSLRILGHGGDQASTRGNFATIYDDDSIRFTTKRLKDGKVEEGTFIVVDGLGENGEEQDITDLLKRIADRSPNREKGRLWSNTRPGPVNVA